jgi:branched-chain amino acid transport system permease protein
MTYGLDLLSQWLEMGLLATSLWLLIQQLGLVSLGHAAFYGLAGYSLALLSQQTSNFWLVMLGSLLGCGLFAAVTGLLALRSKGLFFLMATLAFAQMCFVVAFETNLFGGSDGLYLTRPNEGLVLSLKDPLHRLLLTLMIVLVWLALLLRLTRSPFGILLRAIHDNPSRVISLGYQPMHFQWLAYVLSGVMAGSAGFLHALRFGFVSPQVFAWQTSGMALLMVLLGGRRPVWSGFAGAALVIGLHETLSNTLWFGDWAKHWLAALGLVMVVVALRRR